MATIWEQVTAKAKLTSLPQVYLQLREVLDHPDFAMSDVAAVISSDPGITARLLRLVNSPFFGFAAKIETVSRAISMLGTQQVHDLVLATTVVERFQGMSSEVMDMATYWRRSIDCGVMSRMLAYQCNVLDSERLFVCGLLRDIGHLIMYQSIPQLAQQAIEQATETEQPLYRVEQDLFGLNYARVGGALMRLWGMPKCLQESTEFHIQPDRANEFPLETSIVHLASVLTEAEQSTALEDSESWLHKVNPVAWQVTDLSPQQCAVSREEAGKQVDKVLSLIYPQPARAQA